MRLVATDLDGTALRSWKPGQPLLSDRTIAAVAAVRAAGIPVVVATGRSRRGATRLARTLGADRLICSNGALVWDLDADVVERHHSFDPTVAVRIARRIRELVPTAAFSWESHDAYGWDEAFHARHGGIRADWDPIKASDVEVGCSYPLVKLVASLHDDQAEQLRLFDELAPHLVEMVGEDAGVTTAGGGWVELGPAGVTKAVTLAEVAAELGVAAADVIAFGDGLNDVAMLEWAGHAVAMANAPDRVKEVADEVTLSNDDDGLAVVLERHLRSLSPSG